MDAMRTPLHVLVTRLCLLGVITFWVGACDQKQAPNQTHDASSCSAGETDVDGHCCFVGQTWSTEDAACSGPPACPNDTDYGSGCPPSELDDEARTEWLQAACEGEVWTACNTLGTIAVTSEEAESAREYFTMACDHSDGEACKNLALLHARGIGVKADQKRARALYQRSCDLEFEPACDVVDRMNQMDQKKAADVLARARRACEQGDQDACAKAGGLLLFGRAGEQDVEAALALLDPSCGSGVGEACRMLATAFYAGDQVAADPQRALDFAERGCALDEYDACNILGLLYLLPPGPAPDIGKAREILGRACRAGNPRACGNFGRALLERGDGVQPDAARARDVLSGACDNDVADACARYATLLDDGLGGDVDTEKATRVRRRACDLGARHACN